MPTHTEKPHDIAGKSTRLACEAFQRLTRIQRRERAQRMHQMDDELGTTSLVGLTHSQRAERGRLLAEIAERHARLLSLDEAPDRAWVADPDPLLAGGDQFADHMRGKAVSSDEEQPPRLRQPHSPAFRATMNAKLGHLLDDPEPRQRGEGWITLQRNDARLDALAHVSGTTTAPNPWELHAEAFETITRAMAEGLRRREEISAAYERAKADRLAEEQKNAPRRFVVDIDPHTQLGFCNLLAALDPNNDAEFAELDNDTFMELRGYLIDDYEMCEGDMTAFRECAIMRYDAFTK